MYVLQSINELLLLIKKKKKFYSLGGCYFTVLLNFMRRGINSNCKGEIQWWEFFPYDIESVTCL